MLPFNAVDFAITEAAYTTVRILKRFPLVRLPKGEPVELVGVEKQTMTLVVSITGGCKILVQ
jgi:hypothetical protein